MRISCLMLFIATTTLAACEAAPPAAPAKISALPAPVASPAAPDNAEFTRAAVAMLQESLQHVQLHESPIATLAPEWSVEPPTSIQSWEEATSYADRTLSDRPALRALLLWKFIQKNDPAARLAYLRLPDLGIHTTTPTGETVSYALDFLPPKSTGIPQANVRLSFFHSPEKILAPGILTLKHRAVANIVYDSLSFNVNGKLVAFTRSKILPTGTLTIGANTSGTDAATFYYADFTLTNGPTQPLKLPPLIKQNP